MDKPSTGSIPHALQVTELPASQNAARPGRETSQLRRALEIVGEKESAEQQIATRKDLSLSELLSLQAAAKESTANALRIAASFAVEAGK